MALRLPLAVTLSDSEGPGSMDEMLRCTEHDMGVP